MIWPANGGKNGAKTEIRERKAKHLTANQYCPLHTTYISLQARDSELVISLAAAAVALVERRDGIVDANFDTPVKEVVPNVLLEEAEQGVEIVRFTNPVEKERVYVWFSAREPALWLAPQGRLTRQ